MTTPLITVTATLVLALTAPALATTQPVGGTYLDFGEEPSLHPQAFDWSGPGMRGTIENIRWRHWGARDATATARMTWCATMVGCWKRHVTLDADEPSAWVTCTFGRVRYYGRVRVRRAALHGRDLRIPSVSAPPRMAACSVPGTENTSGG